jgi:hypothetical protein
MVGKIGRFMIAGAIVVALVALVLLSGLVKATKIFDPETGQVVGETFAFGDCRYVGQGKLICPGESPDNVQACLEGVTADASCDADCVLQNTQECVSGLSGVTLAGGPSTTTRDVGVLLPPGSTGADCVPFDEISRVIATKDVEGAITFSLSSAFCDAIKVEGVDYRLHDAVLVAGSQTVATSKSGYGAGWTPVITAEPSAGEYWTSASYRGFCNVIQDSSGRWEVVQENPSAQGFCIYRLSP